jgi:hypothetical protein
MKRHQIDLIALIFGLAFAMVGTGFLVNETTGRDFNPGWAAAVGLVTLGLVALATTLVRRPEEPEET